MHLPRSNRDDHRLAVPFAYLQRSVYKNGQMDMLSGAFYQSHLLDGIEKSRRSAVVKGFGRCFWIVHQVDLDAVSLTCADSLPVAGKFKTLLVILSYKRIEFLA